MEIDQLGQVKGNRLYNTDGSVQIIYGETQPYRSYQLTSTTIFVLKTRYVFILYVVIFEIFDI